MCGEQSHVNETRIVCTELFQMKELRAESFDGLSELEVAFPTKKEDKNSCDRCTEERSVALLPFCLGCPPSQANYARFLFFFFF